MRPSGVKILVVAPSWIGDTILAQPLLALLRRKHPTARIAVDANQSWSRELLERSLPQLASLGVEMVEQPVRRGEDAALDGLRSPLPLAADESCTDRASVARLVEWYQYINIKLDKCGGLTEALAAQTGNAELVVSCFKEVQSEPVTGDAQAITHRLYAWEHIERGGWIKR